MYFLPLSSTDADLFDNGEPWPSFSRTFRKPGTLADPRFRSTSGLWLFVNDVRMAVKLKFKRRFYARSPWNKDPILFSSAALFLFFFTSSAASPVTCFRADRARAKIQNVIW